MIAVLSRETEIATVQTASDGTFEFGEIKTGKYELRVRADNFLEPRFPILLGKPAKKCKRALAIMVTIGGIESCRNNVALVKR